MHLLDVQNISYKYEDRFKRNENVLDGFSAAFDAGKVYVMLGESGAGKTTLLSLLAGLDVCQGGVILYKGKDLKKTNRDRYRAKEVGMVFQQFNLLHRFNPVENVIIAMEISRFKHKNAREYAENLLERVGIKKDMQTRKVIELSGGEQQRVAITRAIAHSPAIILADEPTGSLDENNQKNIMDTLVAFAREDGKCVIISTHSRDVAEYADHVIRVG